MAGEINTTAVLDNLLPDLHADSYANLTFWTQAQLIAFEDQAAKQLSRAAMLFVERDTSKTTINGTRTYSLPARHNATIHVSYATVPLRPATTIEMEARDEEFETTAGPPDHWYEDNLDSTLIGLAPVPDSAASLPMVCSVYPPDLDGINTLLQAPAPVAIYLTYFVLAKAYGKESETEEPDLAQHAAANVALFEQLFLHYYGEGL